MASPPAQGQPLPPAGSNNLNHNNNNNGNSVKKCGYLRKQKHGHKRFFVLKEPGEGCTTARLEYYESEKKWRSKSAAAKRVICLDSCLNINKRADAKNKYLIALYTRDEYFAVAAETEQEQESWYRALTELLGSGRGEKDKNGSTGTGGCCCSGTASCGTNCSSHLALVEDPNYGLITPANAAYREVWQVNLKPRGLGQIKSLIGVHRLCLSARSISFVRLNSETPSVTLQLMNIRRCGHSDNYFFVEVGRSASTGPGEIWMQVDDSVVAQSIHETILEAMKAMKELAEFRPRSKSQSSSSNPISVPGRRHHTQLPPSQTGLARRTRTDFPSTSSSVPGNQSSRLRTASEGDNLSNKTILSSPLSPSMLRGPLSRSHTLSLGGRNGKLFPAPGPLQHSRSMSMPVPHSPPSAASPVSISSGSSGHGSACDPLNPPRPSSCNASASGSPNDPGFMSLDEYSSSPGDLARAYLSCRSGTPDSVSGTPPHTGDMNGYMSMDRACCGGCQCLSRRMECSAIEKCSRKRTYSLTTPGRQKVAIPQLSSASLDEATLVRATYKGSSSLLSSSPKTCHPYPEDYADVEIGRQKDDGYMPMNHGAVTVSSSNDYVPMSPASVSAPQQILQPRTCISGSSQEDSPDGYMPMWCASKTRPVPVHQRLSPAESLSFTPPDYFFMQPKNCCCQSHSTAPQHNCPADVEPYVFMRSPASSSPHGRIARPSRLALRTLPSMSEHPPEPPSPPGGEYIHIYFGETRSQDSLPLPPKTAHSDSAPMSAAGSPSSSSSGSGSGPQPSPISDYMNLDFGPPSPKPKASPSLCPNSDYTEMSPRKTSPQPSDPLASPTAAKLPIESTVSSVQCLTVLMDKMNGAFSLHSPPPDPNMGAKVIRADSQGGRRRHSSETFSSTTQVTPVSPSFAHSPKRHSSASVENVSLRPGETLEASECGSPMCRETSAGFQNGLNYIAIDLSPEDRNLLLLSQASTRGHLPALGLASLNIGSYPSLDFLGHGMKGATTVRE